MHHCAKMCQLGITAQQSAEGKGPEQRTGLMAEAMLAGASWEAGCAWVVEEDCAWVVACKATDVSIACSLLRAHCADQLAHGLCLGLGGGLRTDRRSA